jgi:geranylgeranyl diphosphate synthase, type II
LLSDSSLWSRRSAPAVVRLDPAAVTAYLAEARDLVLDEIRTLMPRDPRTHDVLYGLMLEYPLRHAKALRPALCIATCRALGGRLEAVLRSAAVLELYHNAFLIHDDVEDGSEQRRDRPTLHREHGVPIAVNVGDAMLALALEPLLDNMRLLGMGKALRILQAVARMARVSAEGQAIELDWIRHGDWERSDADYVRMVYKKTSWYTFVTPAVVGAIVAGCPERMPALRKFASLLGVAFQIQDDVLNLEARGPYGKEAAGDLWEGKHTLILMHALRAATPAERERARRILRKQRPAAETVAPAARLAELGRLLEGLEAAGGIAPAARQALAAAVDRLGAALGDEVKTADDVAFLRALVDRHRSIDYARGVARHWALGARRALDACTTFLSPSVHRDFLSALVDFVVDRDR